MRKIALVLCVLAVLMLAAAGCTKTPTEESGKRLKSPTMEIYTLNIGKADCILLRTEGKLVVIDTGEKDTASEVTDAVRSLGKTVDLLIITHYDKDHIGGLEKILKKAEVKQVMLPSYEYEGRTEDVKKELSRANLIAQTVTERIEMQIGEVKLTLLPTALTFPANSEEASNESSLAVLAEHGKNRFLFAGDAIGRRLPELIGQIPEPETVDYVKMPHHGVYEGGVQAFVQALKPEYAVITCSGAARPDGRVVSALTEAGAQTFLTLSGTVIAESDGKEIAVRYFEH